jgi:hypothetical protein
MGSDISAAENFFPEKWSSSLVSLNLAGIEIDGDAEMKVSGEARVLSVAKDGAVIDEESYIVKSDGVYLARKGTAGGDTFEPPIPLLKYPSKVGDKYEWTGTVSSGGPDRIKSEASITTSAESLSLATGTHEAVRVSIALLIHDGPKPAERKMSFWFVKGQGPVKRDFGTNQVRVPRAPGSEKAPEAGKG